MNNRRIDAIYFIVLLVVAAIGYQLSSWLSDEAETSIDPSFGASELVLPEPMVELPEPFWVFHRSPRKALPEAPGTAFADQMESALTRARKKDPEAVETAPGRYCCSTGDRGPRADSKSFY